MAAAMGLSLPALTAVHHLLPAQYVWPRLTGIIRKIKFCQRQGHCKNLRDSIIFNPENSVDIIGNNLYLMLLFINETQLILYLTL